LAKRTKDDSAPIPREHLQQGIAKCVQVAGWRFRETRTILDDGRAPNMAAILFSFGVEEFGKAVLLHEAYESGTSHPIIPGFYNHRAKITAAERHIPKDNLLVRRGAFQADTFSDAFDIIDRPADLDARLSALYVEWRDGQWRVGADAQADVLRANLDVVEEMVHRKADEWR
jgi:AbiV family abortive infection protein